MFRTVLMGLVAATAIAHAEPKQTVSKYPAGTVLGKDTGKLIVVTPPEQWSSSLVTTSNIIYVNRCVGGCTVTGGTTNNAQTHTSTYIGEGAHILSEFKNDAGQSGTAADAEWNAIVQCMKEIYSPFNIVVTETKPATGFYNEAIIAGDGPEVGINPGPQGTVLGVAPAHTDCNTHDNAIAYTFSNNAYFSQRDSQWRIWELCSTAGQESAHLYGLDHAYEFTDMTSACNDPMTYRTDCGGEKFFRNKSAKCGEGAVRECMCGGYQNSHQMLLTAFGMGQTIVPPPTVAIDNPTGGTASDGQKVTFHAGSQRGIEKAELYLNGWKWGEVPGAKFGSNGQANPSSYAINFPGNVPNGVIEIKIKAYDDLGAAVESTPVMVTKGSPCSTADQCLTGQKCDAGKCYWEAPTGQLGDTCDYNEFCTSLNCAMTNQGGYCSRSCIVAATDACPMGFQCVGDGTEGLCLPVDEGGGCCSASGGNSLPVQLVLCASVFGFVVLRRRRR